MMKKLAFVALSSFQFETATSEGECPDINGRSISQGLHYVPGPNKCTLCICENGQPKWCKAVLCSTPQDCKTFRLGNTCCEFICLDDTLAKHPEVFDAHHDFGLRLIAGAITVILFLSILTFMIHRLRQRKLRGRQNRQQCEDERSLASIGYIGGSLSYMGNNCYDVPVNYALWKPPGSFFPRGEAPPPYDEAVAQSRNESRSVARPHTDAVNTFPNHTSNIESLMVNNSGSVFGSQPVTHNTDSRFLQLCRNSADTQIHTTSASCSHGQFAFGSRDNAISSSSADVLPSIRTQHIVSTGNPKLGSVKITSSISLTGARALISAVTRGQPDYGNRGVVGDMQANSGFYVNSSTSNGRENDGNIGQANSACHISTSNSLASMSRHRTIPRTQTMIDADIPKETYRPRKHESSSHRSMSHRKLSERVQQVAAKDIVEDADPRRQAAASTLPADSGQRDRSDGIKQPRISHIKASDLSHEKQSDALGKALAKSLGTLPVDTSKEPLLGKNSGTSAEVVKPSCGCSYDCQPPNLTGDEQEDYYSECENCKSSGSSYYVEWSPCETMTLQRRGKGSVDSNSHAPPRAGATLPNSHAHSQRLLNGSSENRESWFSTIPGGSSSSEED